jgi:hypothetical protein
MRVSFVASGGKPLKIQSKAASSALTDQQCKELRALIDYRAWTLPMVMERFGIDKRTARRYATGVTKPMIYHCEKDLPEGV